MSEGNAAGRKAEKEDTQAPISGQIRELALALAVSAQTALRQADAENGDESYRYDSRGRMRDHEVDIAVRLGGTSAKLAAVLLKIEQFNDALDKKT
jgi:hypothetical protein